MRHAVPLCAAALLALLIAISIALPNETEIDATGAAMRDVQDAPHEIGPDPIAIFCHSGGCARSLAALIENSTRIRCAFYDLDHPDIIAAIAERIGQGYDVRIVLDDGATGRERDSASAHIRIDSSSQQSHNKFCVFDSRVVWTGSFNPTKNDDIRNDNNAAVVRSVVLAKNYEDEFDELWEGTFGKGDRTKTPTVFVNDAMIEDYFCPEDDCSSHVIDAIMHARTSVDFMAFSFTHERIADALRRRMRDGVAVRGVMEKQAAGDSSKFGILRAAGADVLWDKNPGKMHHKVFIIDNETVVTGSFNPTLNGDLHNDENVLIIHDRRIAAGYAEEVGRVYGMARHQGDEEKPMDRR